MIKRKKSLIIKQIILLVFGSIILFITFKEEKNNESKKIITEQTQEKIEKQLAKKSQDEDVFFNIEYTGIDLSGNRYILKSKEAFSRKSQQEIVNLKFVEAIFYFKDDTQLNIFSDSGKYNNQTLDMDFEGNVKATYEDSKLYSQRASFSNTDSFLIISEEVLIDDNRGKIIADKLLFDIKKKQLNISSVKNNKINANINLK